MVKDNTNPVYLYWHEKELVQLGVHTTVLTITSQYLCLDAAYDDAICRGLSQICISGSVILPLLQG